MMTRLIGCTRLSRITIVIVMFALISSILFTINLYHKRDVGLFRENHNFVSRDQCPCVSGSRIDPIQAVYNDTNLAYNSLDKSQRLTIVKPCGSRYGKAVLGDDITVVYNRVPKCGSRMLIHCVRSLKNHIHGPLSMIPQKYKDELPLLTRSVDGVKSRKRAFLEGHVRFNNFQDENVYFFNMVRDPLDRLVSSFYFNRHGDGLLSPKQLEELRKNTHPEVIDETFDECVHHERLSCTGPKMLGYMMGFFCGYHPMCRKPTQWTLEEAKRNLDYYTVVGIVEQYNSSMRALEFLFPSMFSGLVKKYYSHQGTDYQAKSHAYRYVPPSPEVRKLMKEKMRLEYEFYEYAKLRFDMLLDELHLKDSDVR
ncbi:uronyl 2-sulfotransferase-like [Lytechinus variegatus]|uniref:uronyl 2-sulfotransferase-like n=2 Tax=Lytechinus variegatus TaxID=7654 RepID=UPI001BB15BD3|nr:uronyl 2-sulfotransferase-like [Lytechinus variegatus]